VTLRAQSPVEVVRIAAAAGLQAIEWGGDVHVPPGDERAARTARQATEDAGLAVASYGSYYRSDGDSVGPIVATAAALGAPRIRIWAGSVGSAEASVAEWNAVVDGARAMRSAAGAAGIDVAFEFHRGTLTDDPAAALKLVTETGVDTYWQPPVGLADDDALDGLRTVLDHVRALHVFSWWPTTERLPLAHRKTLWRKAFGLVPPIDALLEFVPDDDPASIATEAATLRALIGD
jgi:sugar phosphate isomerase/epimerase